VLDNLRRPVGYRSDVLMMWTTCACSCVGEEASEGRAVSTLIVPS
jgi:hypothetical protein